MIFLESESSKGGCVLEKTGWEYIRQKSRGFNFSDFSDLVFNLDTGEVRVPRMRRAICRISWGPAQTRPSTVFRRRARDLHWVLLVL